MSSVRRISFQILGVKGLTGFHCISTEGHTVGLYYSDLLVTRHSVNLQLKQLTNILPIDKLNLQTTTLYQFLYGTV